jgi:hypothetical protein
MAFRGSGSRVGWGKVRFATVLHGLVRPDDSWFGEARLGCLGLCGVRRAAVWRGLSWRGLVPQGPVRFAAVRHAISRPGVAIQGSLARGAVACATARLGLSWHGRVTFVLFRRGVARLGLSRLGQSRRGPVRLGRARLLKAMLAKASPGWVRSGSVRSFLACWGLAGFASPRPGTVWSGPSRLGEASQGSAGRPSVRSGVSRFAKAMWALARCCKVWRFRVRSAVGLAWPVDVRCARAGSGAVRQAESFPALAGRRVARFRNVRSADVRHGEVCLGLSRRAVPWRVRARLPEVW